jgi:hypothetical protein
LCCCENQDRYVYPGLARRPMWVPDHDRRATLAFLRGAIRRTIVTPPSALKDSVTFPRSWQGEGEAVARIPVHDARDPTDRFTFRVLARSRWRLSWCLRRRGGYGAQ